MKRIKEKKHERRKLRKYGCILIQNKSHGRKSGQFRIIIIRQMYLVLRFCGYTRFTFFVCMSVCVSMCVVRASFGSSRCYCYLLFENKESQDQRERGKCRERKESDVVCGNVKKIGRQAGRQALIRLLSNSSYYPFRVLVYFSFVAVYAVIAIST